MPRVELPQVESLISWIVSVVLYWDLRTERPPPEHPVAATDAACAF